jgi:hypothetical protein
MEQVGAGRERGGDVSRLESFLRRLTTQRLLLDRACQELNELGDALPGPAIELGLGNGRTYDHLREKLERRRIIVFDRQLVAHPASRPPPEDLVLGDIRSTGMAHAGQHGAVAALLHADLGNGVAADDLELQKWLPDVAHALVRPGGKVITSTELSHPGLRPEPLPEAARSDFFVYRRLQGLGAVRPSA